MRLLLAILLLLFALPVQAQNMQRALVVSSCGGGALPSGALTNLTMNPQGQLCLVGISGGSGGCAQATAYLARTTGGNEGGNAANITTLICGLVTDGVWSNLDALYVLAQQNVTDANLNLIGTSYSPLVPFNGPSFTSYVGYGPFSSNAALDTNFNASTAPSPHYTPNSASYGVWSYATVTENFAVMGNGAAGAADSILYTSFSGSAFYARVNDNTGGSVPTPGTKGLFVGDRPSSTSVVPYWNGISQGSLSSTSAGVANATFTIGASQGFFSQGDVSPKVGTAQTLCEAHIGASLGSAGNLALYNRLRTYMSAVGIP
jgi:hypothetical protein